MKVLKVISVGKIKKKNLFLQQKYTFSCRNSAMTITRSSSLFLYSPKFSIWQGLFYWASTAHPSPQMISIELVKWKKNTHTHEGWVPKNWYFQIVVLEKTLKNPLGCKEIKPVNPKENQPWILIGRTNAELKLQHFEHLIGTANSLEKTLRLGKTEGRRRGGGWQRMRWLDGITD